MMEEHIRIEPRTANQAVLRRLFAMIFVCSFWTTVTCVPVSTGNNYTIEILFGKNASDLGIKSTTFSLITDKSDNHTAYSAFMFNRYLNIVKLVCENGLIYDPNTNTCVPPGTIDVPDSSSSSSESSGQSNSTESSGSSSSSESSSESDSASVSHCKSSPAGKNLVCTAEGFFQVLGSHRVYQCVKNGDGTFRKIEMPCNAHAPHCGPHCHIGGHETRRRVLSHCAPERKIMRSHHFFY